MRLDKYLRDCGYGTRSEIRLMVRNGRVSVNASIVNDPAAIIDEAADSVLVDGQELVYTQYVWFMLNKPAGYITANKGKVPTVMDLVPEPYLNLYPVGRLDKDTEGLLLITNDGMLGHSLLSPRKHVEKEYYVELKHEVSEADAARIAEGLTGENGIVYAPAECRDIAGNTCRIILHEGKYHEIKRIFMILDNTVTYLRRIRMKNLVLDEALKPGEYRRLTQEEIKGLYE
ncbi:MAG: rRNA pseudouridine synthase [Solobacterium sp.]|nr:rRNA pseudouridine synthase [Solobacterium sp.]